MLSTTSWLLLILIICLVLTSPAEAFGAGSIPIDNEYKGYLWRHGDIVDVLKYLPTSFATGYHFTKLQRKQVYFGNWLRDFSQVIDTTCLENIPEPVLRGIVSIMAFMEFGLATDEFDVTRERLGCYRHEEHIDNPRGYQNDAKKVDERLRGPVDPKELEIDPKSGMKNYIANSGQGWTTSVDYIRSQLQQCIEKGRRGRARDALAKKEAMINLGAALHTLEDFAAHSNYIELVLNQLGEDKIFAFVGDTCRVETSQGDKVAPLTTGTFGMLDIFQSLLGEADDMAILQSKGGLSQFENLGYGRFAFNQAFDIVKNAVTMFSQFASDKAAVLRNLELVNTVAEKIQKEDSPNAIKQSIGDDPHALWQAIEPIFYIHDRVAKWLNSGDDEMDDDDESVHSVESTTNKLGEYSDELAFKFIGLLVETSAKEWRDAVRAAREKVDNEAAQSTSAEVYQEGSTTSDPSHSDLSKDHYSHVLNRPAGLLATVTTNWTTQQVVHCWDDDEVSADDTINAILTVLHHPQFVTEPTEIQKYMFQAIEAWWAAHTDKQKDKLRDHLSKSSCQKRGHEDHHMTIKDFEGQSRGHAEFPGSRPHIEKPPKPQPVLDSIKAEVWEDFNKAMALAQESMVDPAGAVTKVASNMSGFAFAAMKTVLGLPWYAVDVLRRALAWRKA